MEKIASEMKLKSDFKEEYKQRRYAIWSEPKELFKESGISNSTVFLHAETDVLFAVQKLGGEQS